MPAKLAIRGDVVDGPSYKNRLSQQSSSCFDIAVNCTNLFDGAIIIDLQLVLSA